MVSVNVENTASVPQNIENVERPGKLLKAYDQKYYN